MIGAYDHGTPRLCSPFVVHDKQIVGEEWDEAAGKYNQVGENHYLD